MNTIKILKRVFALMLCLLITMSAIPMGAYVGGVKAHGAEVDSTLSASLSEAKAYIDALTINNSSNDPATVVKNFKTHFTWDNEKRENSKSYLFDWSYYNGVVFEGLEFVYEVTGESVYKDYVIEYMSNLIASNGTWATCSNNSSKQCAGYNSTHGADCYKTASLLLDAYEMTNDSRYLTMAKTLYADLDTAASKYSLTNAGNNYRHTWASDPSPDLWLDGLYMILPFRAEYAKYIGDQEELDLIVSRMQWVSDNMYNNSKKLFYHAADNASSNSGTYWLRSIGWYAAAIVDIMDSMEGENLESMKQQLIKLVDGMKACQNASNGMWLNNMNASQSSTNPYETSGTALVCYAVMKAVNEGWLDSSYADMAILAFNGICNEKLSGTTLKDICFKGAPGSSNSTFYNNEGKGVGPFIMFYAEMLEYVNNSACEHNYNVDVKDATCTEDGSATYTCTLCGEGYTEVIASSGHNYTKLITSPDCENGGYTTYNCTSCGDTYKSDYTNATGHSYNKVTTNATCASDGKIVYTCSCGDTYEEVIPATGAHNYKEEIKAATCTENGEKKYVCSVCGDSYSEVIKATGHNYKLVVTSPDCLNGGYTTYTCLNCNESYKDNYTSALGHNYKVTTQNASCVENGKIIYTCACGDTYEEIIPATGKHVYETSTTEATCANDGKIVYTCACGDTYEEVINALGHNYVSKVIAPDCLNEGYTVHTCARCSDTYKDAYLDALGHSYSVKVTAPDCENEGYTTYTCHCGDSYVSDIKAALGHKYESLVIAPTCTNEGYTNNTCSVCGNSYISEKVPALGHTYGKIVTEPTCTEGGYTLYFCSCGDSYYGDETNALGHSYNEVVTKPTCEAEGYTTYTCHCGYTYVGNETSALGHNYTYIEENGTRIYTCVNCGDTYEESINWVNLGGSYVLDTDGIDLGSENKYLVVGSNKNYALKLSNGSISAAAVTITNNTITLDNASNCEFYFVKNSKENNTYLLTQDGSKTVYHMGGNIYYGNDNKGYWYVSSSGNGSYKLYDYDNLNWYLNYGYVWGSDSVSRFAVSSNSRTVRLFKATDAYVRLMGTMNQNYEHFNGVTVEDIISKLYIEKSADGKNVESTVNLTSDMLVWNTSFNGAKAGVYEATVVYNGAELGKVTVTIGSEHNYSSSVTAPTCTNDGYTTYTCVCGDSYISEKVPALGHTYGTIVTEPTCTEDGYTLYFCSCGDSYKADEVPAFGHTYEAKVTAPTCESEGFTTYTCTTCSHSYTGNGSAALGHKYSSTETDTAIIYTCENCGNSYEESIAPEYSYNKVSKFASGEKYVITLYSGNKYYAISHKNNTLSVAQVTVSNGVITSEVSDDMLWDYNGNKLSYSSNSKTYYLNLKTTSSWWGWNTSYTLEISTSSSSTVTLSSNKIKVGSRYLRYSNGTVTNSSSGTTTYIYQETEK
ncbi:MAG: hypothetical protein E7564_04985 [Ruminococcaceae bacterium]|nr:hypothetical protein [Oscillospiraceae bacterium]